MAAEAVVLCAYLIEEETLAERAGLLEEVHMYITIIKFTIQASVISSTITISYSISITITSIIDISISIIDSLCACLSTKHMMSQSISQVIFFD